MGRQLAALETLGGLARRADGLRAGYAAVDAEAELQAWLGRAVALVGKAPGRYNLHLGGDGRGQRLNVLHLENVDEPAILEALDAAFARWSAERQPGERFGDFAWRSGLVGAPQRERGAA